jgi:hypothetical protein
MMMIAAIRIPATVAASILLMITTALAEEVARPEDPKGPTGPRPIMVSSGEQLSAEDLRAYALREERAGGSARLSAGGRWFSPRRTSAAARSEAATDTRRPAGQLTFRARGTSASVQEIGEYEALEKACPQEAKSRTAGWAEGAGLLAWGGPDASLGQVLAVVGIILIAGALGG